MGKSILRSRPCRQWRVLVYSDGMTEAAAEAAATLQTWEMAEMGTIKKIQPEITYVLVHKYL